MLLSARRHQNRCAIFFSNRDPPKQMGKVTIHGCGLLDSLTPGLPGFPDSLDSRTPGLSGLPGLPILSKLGVLGVSSKVSCRGLIAHRIFWIEKFSELYVLTKEFLWGRNGRFSTVERAILYMGGQNWCCWIIAIGQLFTCLTHCGLDSISIFSFQVSLPSTH